MLGQRNRQINMNPALGPRSCCVCSPSQQDTQFWLNVGLLSAILAKIGSVFTWVGLIMLI